MLIKSGVLRRVATSDVCHANNDKTGNGNAGVTYTNNHWVLRYVLGV